MRTDMAVQDGSESLGAEPFGPEELFFLLTRRAKRATSVDFTSPEALSQTVERDESTFSTSRRGSPPTSPRSCASASSGKA